MSDAATPATLTCERHGEATRIRCVECGTPVCPRCMVRTEVGHRCTSCAAGDGAEGHEHTRDDRPGRSTASPRLPRNLVIAVGGVVLLVVAIVLFATGGSDDPEGPGVIETSGAWQSLPDLSAIRGTTAAVVLDDGRVLAAGGGVGSLAVQATELLENGTWMSGAAMTQARRGAGAVLLPDGRVLVAGGIADNQVLASAEVYDPTRDAWTAAAPMATARVTFTLSVLPDGRVLAAGGSSPQGVPGNAGGQTIQPTPTAEIWDPATDTWDETAPMRVARFEHTATTLPDGRILIAGGAGGDVEEGQYRSLALVEIFDSAIGAFTTAAEMAEGRSNHVAVPGPDGGVIIMGGIADIDGTPRALASVERYDVSAGRWESLPAMRQARSGAAAVLLPDGSVLVAGGEAVQGGSRRSLDTTELLRPDEDGWISGGQLACPRSEHAAVLLSDGTVVALAGDAAFPGEPPVARGCVEQYEPASG